MNSQPSQEPFQISKSLLHTKRYSLYWISSLLSNIGTWMQQVAQPWVILSLGHSSFWVGLDSFAMNAPGWVFTLWGGFLADRFDRKRIVLFCQGIQFVCIFVLLALLLMGKIQIWIILLSSFIIGTTDALSMPSFQSIIPSLVGESEISRAIALNSTQFNLSRILGPAIAGVVIAAYGASVCYATNLISYVPFFLSLYWIYPRQGFKVIEQAEGDSSRLRAVDFLNILKDKKFQKPLATLLVTTFFCGPLLTFCSVLVKDYFHGSASDLGWSMAAFGIGGVVGSVIPSFFSTKLIESQRYSNIVAAALGAILISISFVPSLILLDLALALAGGALTTSNTAVNSILQKSASNHIRGRVISLFQLALHGGLALGGLLTGAISAPLGLKRVLFVNGLLAMILQFKILLSSRNHP